MIAATTIAEIKQYYYMAESVGQFAVHNLLYGATVLKKMLISNRCVFDSFCFKHYLVSDFIARNYESRV